nr:hypothetical protein [Pedobacter sp. MC2016-05]
MKCIGSIKRRGESYIIYTAKKLESPEAYRSNPCLWLYFEYLVESIFKASAALNSMPKSCTSLHPDLIGCVNNIQAKAPRSLSSGASFNRPNTC